ncbi:MAG: hypothetical protein R3D26_16775 [Cyanobacteriota/Melainabacteria group bacterium]
MKKNVLRVVIPVATTSVMLTGCDTAALNKRIEEFDSALIKSSDSMKAYYEELNTIQRVYYFDKLRFKPAMEILKSESKLPPGAVAPEGKAPEIPTELVAKFSPADIEVRVSAIKALGKFGEGLAALAGSDAPQRTGKSIEEIGDSVQSINNHIGSLSGKKDPSFVAYSTPIATLASIVAENWLKSKQNNSVRKSIIESKKCVPDLIDTFKTEIKELDKDLIVQSAAQSLQYRIDYYNKVYVNAEASESQTDQMIEDSKRKAFLNETITSADKLNKIKSINPLDMVTSLETAYNKLLKKVESKPSYIDLLTKKKTREEAEEELRDLSQSIGAFLEEANRVAEAVKEIKRISSSK